jgi:hypothetical protein
MRGPLRALTRLAASSSSLSSHAAVGAAAGAFASSERAWSSASASSSHAGSAWYSHVHLLAVPLLGLAAAAGAGSLADAEPGLPGPWAAARPPWQHAIYEHAQLGLHMLRAGAAEGGRVHTRWARSQPAFAAQQSSIPALTPATLSSCTHTRRAGPSLLPVAHADAGETPDKQDGFRLLSLAARQRIFFKYEKRIRDQSSLDKGAGVCLSLPSAPCQPRHAAPKASAFSILCAAPHHPGLPGFA